MVIDGRDNAGADWITSAHGLCTAAGRALPAVIVTGDTSPAVLAHARASGYRVLHKPAAPEQLVAAVSEAVAANG